MKYKIDYLLKFISNDTYFKIINNKGEYVLGDLEDNRIDVSLNIRFLIKYGVKNIDNVVYDRLDDLLLEHNEFIKKMENYEKTLGREGFINMIENVQEGYYEQSR